MRATRTALAGIFAIPVITAVAVPAEAQTIDVAPVRSEADSGTQQLSSCGTSIVTLFSGPNYTGSYVEIPAGTGWVNLASLSLNNTIESWVNQTTCQQLLTDNVDGTGAWLPMAANSKAGSMGNWANRAGSAYIG
jgi:hypothetical protein